MRLLCAVLLILGALQDQGPWRVVFERNGKLWSVRQDGSDAKAEAGKAPRGTLSPDGKRRVYAATNNGEGEIWVSDADGSHPKRLTDPQAVDSQPFWTSDSKRIVFASNRSGLRQIWIMEADGSNAAKLTDHPGGASQPQVSPGGDLIAYLEEHESREKLPPSSLRIMDLAGRNSKVLLEKAQILQHAWDPKGKRIACSVVAELRILEVPSGKPVRTFKFEDIHKDLYAHAAYGVLWRPDGGAIACTIQFLGGRMEGAEVFGDDQLFVLPFEGKPTIYEAGGPAGPVRWTR
jgi:dipeptidyl aminopeptidase/acylaminoacyl peptidase